MLSNIYLHFMLDLWFEKKFKPQCRGEAYLVRFADDFVVSFQFRRDARSFQRQLRERFARVQSGAGRGENSAACSLGVLPPRMRRQAWTEAGDVRVSGLQACLWGGSGRALCPDPYPQHQELPEVPRPHPGVAACMHRHWGDGSNSIISR